jgi:hypothetical protein
MIAQDSISITNIRPDSKNDQSSVSSVNWRSRGSANIFEFTAIQSQESIMLFSGQLPSLPRWSDFYVRLVEVP